MTQQPTHTTSQYLKYGAIGAGTGLLINMASGFLANPGSYEDSYVREARKRIATTYGYLFGSVTVTGGLAALMYQNGVARYLLGMNQWVYLGVSMAAMYGSLMFTRSTPYENTVPKHMGLLALNASMAASLSGFGYLGGPLVAKAAALTGVVVGSLSLAGAAAPSETWMSMHGPLAIGLGVVFGASIGQMFMPSPLLMNIALYGGAAVFGGFVLYDTGKIRHNARVANHYDPINNSLGIYITTVNLFRIIASMLANRNQRRR
jgi:FtsH-binding integral membrane protein